MPEEKAEIWSKEDILKRYEDSTTNQVGDTVKTIISEFKEFSQTKMGKQLLTKLLSNILGDNDNMKGKNPKGMPKVQDVKKGKIEDTDNGKDKNDKRTEGINKETIDKIEKWLSQLPDSMKNDMTVKELENSLNQNKEQLLQLIDSGIIDEFMENYGD